MTHTPKIAGIDDPRPHEVDTSAMDARELADQLRQTRIGADDSGIKNKQEK